MDASAASTGETIHATDKTVLCRMQQIAHLKIVNVRLQILYIIMLMGQLLVQVLYLTSVRPGSLQQERRLVHSHGAIGQNSQVQQSVYISCL